MSWVGAATPWGIHPLTPVSLIIALPSFWLGYSTFGEQSVLVYITLFPILVFALFSSHLVRGSATIPMRSKVFFALLLAGSALWFGVAWSSGVQYQGATYVWVSFFANVLAAAICFTAFLAHRTNPSWLRGYLFHSVLFLWFGWLSFPWLGEMP